MRKIILSVGAILAFGFANAQDMGAVKEEMDTAKGMDFEKGNMFIEGGIKITTGDTSNDYFAINPKFGYFVNNKLAVGADLDFSSDKSYINDDKTSTFGVGLFARYYFLSLAQSRLKAYGEAGVGYSHQKFDPNVGDSDTTNGIKANIDLGLNYFFTENWAATFTLANILSYNNANPENGGSTNDFELNINLFENIFATPQFGLLYKF
ncbi:outer membrane protein [Flavobacterium chuncheonense]|uniref:Outer membrane protein n=1 Tax=Flavobacterium chuncheonense TaxID=2026653 RepID=A0ABW5YIA8_9FLAO